MGKRYVMINELKPEHVQDYIDMHMNCPSSEIYKGQLDALKEAGAEECIVYPSLIHLSAPPRPYSTWYGGFFL